jgi:exonuclease SbcC
MKPLQLSIEGLHSFKEKQSIDFSELSETGLFGIFGKTGSGKSTILDAVTLALYGVVCRAASRTQGILNSQRDKLEVSFSFAIGGGAGRKIYRVERGFKRHKERRDSIQTMVCRLVEVRPDQEVMVAENTNEVNRKIEAIIGLNMEDFTRSVVLPQGEFAKFLQLKDSERVRMLERIFALADYGSRLTEKVKRERERLARQLELVERAIQEQGEISPEQLTALKTEVAQKETELARLVQEAAGFESRFEERREVWQLQTELEQALAKQRLHLQTRNEMALKKAILEQAEQAQQVWAYLENTEKAASQLSVSREELQTVSAVYQNETLASQQVKAEFSKVEAVYLQKQPKLIAKRTQLEGLLTLEAERQTKETQQVAISREMKRLAGIVADFDTKLSEAERDKAAKEAKRQELEAKTKELALDVASKERLWQGVDLEKEWERSRVSREKIQANLDERTQQQTSAQQELNHHKVSLVELAGQLDRLQAQLEEHQAKKPGDLESFARRNQELSRLENTVNQIKARQAELDTLQTELDQLLEKLKPLQAAQEHSGMAVAQQQQELKDFEELQSRLAVEVKTLEEKNLAASLARALRAGKPCPVCGSSHHPRLAEQKNELLEVKKVKLAEVEADLRLKREQLERVNRELFQALIQTEQYQVRRQEIQDKIDAVHSKLGELQGDLEPEFRTKTPAELVAYHLQAQGELEAYRQSISDWEERSQKLQTELTTAKTANLNADNQVRLLTGQCETDEKNRRKLQEELQTAETVETGQLQQLQSWREELGIAGFQAEQARWLDSERRTDAMRAKITELTAELAALETTIVKLRQEREVINRKVWECQTTVQNLNTEITERQTKIDAVTEGKSPQELLTAIDAYLAKLVQKYEALKECWENSQASLQLFNNQLVEARKQLELSQEAAAQSELALERALREKGFLHRHDLQAALRSPIEQAELKAEITEFEDAGKRCEHQIDSLTQKLAGRELAAAEWQRTLAMKEQLTTQREQLLASHAAGLAKLAESETRFAKIKQYRGERRETVNRKAMVDEITKLLQGEAFVAYIAEEHMRYILWDASRRLEMLTGGRYRLIMDENKDFSVADNTNGGIARPVSSLSGGETFLVSLSLALALSGKIQLNGRNPLEFFFLDEGFGTLDPQLLEVVVDSLEKLRQENLTIGVISHMPELRNRISRRLLVTAASPDGTGSRVRVEKA